MGAWKSESCGKNVFRVKTEVEKNKSWEFWALLTSDRHWDNPKSNRDLQEEHLNQAVERNAVVIDCGDLFCMMQGKFDKRSSKSSVRPEHQTDTYLDDVVEDASNYFSPWAKQFLLIGKGNHETAITKNHEIDPTERLVTLLNSKTGSRVYNGQYSGWVIFSFTDGEVLPRGRDPLYAVGGAPPEQIEVRQRTRNSIVLHWDHGYGGGGPVTADMIQHQRRALIFPDADIIISGHTHDSWMREFSRVRLTSHGQIRHDIQTHIKLPTYKEEYQDGSGGWHVETGKPPKPLGAYWLHFTYSEKLNRVIYTVEKASSWV